MIESPPHPSAPRPSAPCPGASDPAGTAPARATDAAAAPTTAEWAGWAERAAADGVVARLTQWAAVARTARVLVASGRRIDLAGIDNEVGLLCARALDLHPALAARLRGPLAALQGELAALSAALADAPRPAAVWPADPA